MNQTIDLKNLPFYWRVRNSLDDKNVVPNYLPLELDFDEKIQLFKQRANLEVERHLRTIYQQYPNIGHNQEISNWKNYYGKDLHDFIVTTIKNRKLKVNTVLEIGSGGCVILEKFRIEGYTVLGIDPSPFSRLEGEKKGVQVIEDFFPSAQITGTFDLIFHSNVLEHIPEPLEFLKSQLNLLNDDGITVMAVPDCTDSLRYGDISVLYHQHLYFFDTESLKYLVTQAGFVNVSVRKANYGGNLYVVAQKSKRKHLIKPQQGCEKFSEYLKKHDILFSNFTNYVNKILKDKKKTLGFYAPLRALPYLAKMNLFQGFRFFDDTSYWYRKYFDGVNVVFENFDELKLNPVTDIIIMSPTFGVVIEKKIKKEFGKKIRVKKIKDFYINPKNTI